MQKYVECDLQQSKSREREKWTMWGDWALSCAVVESLLYLSRRLLGCLNKTKQRLTQASCRPHSALDLCVNKSNWFAALIWFQSDFARHFQTFAFLPNITTPLPLTIVPCFPTCSIVLHTNYTAERLFDCWQQIWCLLYNTKKADREWHYQLDYSVDIERKKTERN